MHYCYQPLEVGVTEIRLLWIPRKTSSSGTSVNHTLIHTSLQQARTFIALSYCWGDLGLDHELTVNGSLMNITDSLATALINLQSEDEDVLLWADAICINQQDPIEKTSQLRKLGGELMDAGLWELNSDELLHWNVEETDTSKAASTKRSILKLKSEHLQKAQDDEYPFWWIMSDLGKRKWFKAVSLYFRVFNFHSLPNIDEDVQAFWKHHWLTDMLSNALPTTVIGIRRKYLVEGGHDLHTLLHRVIVKDSSDERIDATDPRDRIYALLGIANDEAAKEIVADYTLSYWSIDLRKPWSTWHAKSRLFNASGEPDEAMKDCMIFGSEERLDPDLTLKGAFVDTIKTVGHSFLLGINEKISMSKLRQFFNDISEYLSQSDIYTPEQKQKAEWRIPVGDTEIAEGNSQVGRIPPASLRNEGFTVAKAMADETASPEQLKENILPFARFQCQLSRMYDSRPFISDTGYVGLCPLETQAGDKITIFMEHRSYLMSKRLPGLTN
ncbi:hypothetical protein GQ44DRAFT_800820 [Phaeosphaeriaceae sp. PMI808]|nr:hypothetical protein GQ44DRAFT_800820 [Phaeosphaeriaceae sp. PMI808]